MKRVNRRSRRGGSRPGMRVVNPVGGGVVDRDTSRRCKCSKTGQIFTCMNMDCPECLDSLCSTVPYRNTRFERRKASFAGNIQGMLPNAVSQRNVGVSPSQGGFFSVPQDERNYGQQAGLPMDQQLNMNHSNFGANTSSSTWSGAQTNVGPQDRVFAGSYASGCGYSNMNHMNMNHSDFGGNTAASTWSGAQTNVGPQDRVFAGSYAAGKGVSRPSSRKVRPSNVKPPIGGSPAERDSLCMYKCDDNTFCTIKAPNCDFVDFSPCCKDSGAMVSQNAQQMNMAGRRRNYQVRR